MRNSYKKIKIAVGGIEHETAGFLSGCTPLDDFLKLRVGAKALSDLPGLSNTVVDGYISGIKEHGWDLAPLVWYKAQSGAPASEKTFHYLLTDLLENLQSQLPVDGILLSLHGAFAVEGIDDADGYILQAVRKLVGGSCPILVVHDLHCNITKASVDSADILIVMRTYPHVDMHERAIHAVNLLSQILEGSLKPTMAFRSLPILWSAPRMIDALPPMNKAVKEIKNFNQKQGVVSISLGVGFQWIDSPGVGVSVIVVTNNDYEKASYYTDQLAEWIWDKRGKWVCKSLKPEKALIQGIAIGKYPIILADQADNTGGGAPGDSTEILRMFIDQGLERSAILYMVDPESALAAHKIGVGGKMKRHIGGISHEKCGPPVLVDAEVVALSDGKFVYDGPMWEGVEDSMGLSACIRQNGVSIVIISHKKQPIDLAFCRTLGMECSKMKYLGIKSTGHFRSGFEFIAGSIFNVDACGLLTQDFRELPYSRLGRPVYPVVKTATRGW